MSPASKLFLSFFNRIKYTILPIIILSIVVYFMTRGYYASLPSYFLSESKLFPVKDGNNSQAPQNPFFAAPSSSSSDFYNLDELISSRTIREEIAKRRIWINGGEAYVYEYAIKDHDDNPDNKASQFGISDNIRQNIINGAKSLAALTSITTNESSFVKLTTKSYNEDFAVALGNEVIDVLSDFYVKFNQKPLDNNFYRTARMKDSLEYELDRYETAYAKYLDENKFIVKQEQNITEKRLLRKLASIENALTSVTTNYYASKSKVDDNKPILKVLDRPMKPLKKEESKYKSYPIALALLAFIFLIIISNTDIILRYISESMALQRERLISQES